MPNETLGRCPDCGAAVLVTIRPGPPADIPPHGCPSRDCEQDGCRVKRPADEMVQFASGGWYCPGHALLLAASDLVTLYRAEGAADWKGISEVIAEALPDIIEKVERFERTRPA